ncbi:MAG: hypothetical protein AAFZ80_05590 [Cyanobacteria bacterium P01_A01_bin.105]
MASQLTWRAWNLLGLSVTRLRIDDEIALEIEAADCALTLVLKADCYLQVGNRVRQRLVPAQPATLGPLLPVLQQPLLRFMVSSEGHCKLLLANSTVIWAEPAPVSVWASQGRGSLVSASHDVSRSAVASAQRALARP